MANSRLSMRKIKDVLRLHFQLGLTVRQIGQSLNISHNTAIEYLRRSRAANIGWPLPPGLSDSDIESLLFPPLPPSTVKRPEPNWADVHIERKRRSVTLLLLWEEYKAQHPDGLQYSCFCDRYRAFVSKLKPSMRQIHLAGEKAFIDYAGQTLPIQDPFSGEVREAHARFEQALDSHQRYADENGGSRERALAVEPSERLMCGIWFYGCKRGAASIIETMNQSGIASEAFGGCNIFDAVIFPQASIVAEGTHAAFGGHPCPRQDNNIANIFIKFWYDVSIFHNPITTQKVIA